MNGLVNAGGIIQNTSHSPGTSQRFTRHVAAIALLKTTDDVDAPTRPHVDRCWYAAAGWLRPPIPGRLGSTRPDAMDMRLRRHKRHRGVRLESLTAAAAACSHRSA